MKNSQKKNLALTVLLVMSISSVPAMAAEGTKILQRPSVVLTAEKLEGNYDLQLYFGNTEPYLDNVHFERGADQKLRGTMHVPNDFDADLTGLLSDDASLRFEVLVPANGSRPQDMVFLYESTISPHDTTKLAGHVTLTRVGQEALEKPEYLASFVLFKK